MAMAPMQTVRELVTKASTNLASLALPVLILSHSPNRSKPSSIRRSSPMTVPMARHSTINMERPPEREAVRPSPAMVTCSMPSMAPAIAIKRTLIPQTLQMASCCWSLKKRPVKCPAIPPAMTAAVLIKVPVPGISLPSCLRIYIQFQIQSISIAFSSKESSISFFPVSTW